MVRTTAPGAARTREQRWHERWDRSEGPSAVERWYLGDPRRMAVLFAVLFGASSGWHYVRLTEAPLAWASLAAAASWLTSVGLAFPLWHQARRRAAAYVDWASSRGVGDVGGAGGPGTGVWLLAVVAGVVAALAWVAFETRPTPAPPPDGEAIARAISGSSGGGYDLLDADTASTGPRELSLEESELTTWDVATRDADGACHALRFVDGELDELAPLPEPCTGRHAAQRHS